MNINSKWGHYAAAGVFENGPEARTCKGPCVRKRSVVQFTSKHVAKAAVGLAILIGVALPAMAQQTLSITTEPRVLQTPLRVDALQVTALSLRAKNRGLVRVIARVAHPATGQAGPVAEADLTASLEQLRSHALTIGVTRIEPIASLPLSVLEVNSTQLENMVRAGLISDVVEDVPQPLALQDSIPLIHADTAVTLGATGAGQSIVILDSGLDATHPFFGGRVVSEACYSSNSPANGATSVCPGGVTTSTASGSAAACSPAGCNHGTHVAGIAAGQDFNRRGVAPQANIIAIQVFSQFTDRPGSGGPQSCANAGIASPCILSYQSDQIRGLQRAFDLRNTFTIASVNISVGGSVSSTGACDAEPQKGAIDQLRAVDIATVVAAGNNGSSTAVSSPGCISTAVTVGSTTKNDLLSSFSNSAAGVDLLAPGSSITSSVPGGGFAVMSGTSMATPHVAGAFAALRSLRNQLTVDQIQTALSTTGVSIIDNRNKLSRPRIDIAAAVGSSTDDGSRFAAIWQKQVGPGVVARHGMTSTQYQQQYDDLVGKQHLCLVDVSGYEVGGEDLYAAIWENKTCAPFVARHGMTSAQYQQLYDDLVGKQGFRLKLVNGYQARGQDYYAAIFEKSPGPAFVAKHRLTLQELQIQFDDLVKKQGFCQSVLSGYAIGAQTQYAAIWEKGPCPAFEARAGMNSTQYQQTYDQLVGQYGYHLKQVSGHKVGGQESYAAIWEKSPSPALVALHGMTSAQYQQQFNDLVGRQGFRLIWVKGY